MALYIRVCSNVSFVMTLAKLPGILRGLYIQLSVIDIRALDITETNLI